MILALISTIFNNPRLMLTGAAGIGVIVVVAAVYFEGRSVGHHAAMEGVAKQDARAARAAAAAEQSVDFCYDAGRAWDVATGRCR